MPVEDVKRSRYLAAVSSPRFNFQNLHQINSLSPPFKEMR